MVHCCTCRGKAKWVSWLTRGKIGIGRWREERHNVLNTVRENIVERGAANFTFGGEIDPELASPSAMSSLGADVFGLEFYPTLTLPSAKIQQFKRKNLAKFFGEEGKPKTKKIQRQALIKTAFTI
jgi:hypothetical protein